MQVSVSQKSIWRQLQASEIVSCQEALRLLVNAEGVIQLEELDAELNARFFRAFEDRNLLPPVIPLLLWRNCYYLGCPTKLPKETIDQLAERAKSEIKIVTIAAESYRAWFRTQNVPDQARINSERLINPLTGETEQADIGEVTNLYLSQAADQTRRINALISVALQNRASDIHLEPNPKGLRVRYRIDGILRDVKILPMEMSRKIVVALKVMSNMDIADSRRPQDGRIGKEYSTEDNLASGLDMRVSTLPCVGGEKAVIRLLPRDNPFSKNLLNGLGFTARTLETYERWLGQPQGLVVLTGPTGSGKTSTLYTSLQMIATEQVNVVTVEDPVEYVLSNITQTQVNELAGMTFAAGLRAILRQDPDVVMVGEVRDPETAETVIRAALTGHLVLSTMHTNDAPSAIPRLKDLGPDPGLVSDALLGIVAQRLVRKVCPHCGHPYVPKQQELDKLGLDRNSITDEWRKGKGCDKCFGSGYLGREAVVELVDVDDTIRELIYDGTPAQLNRYLRKINYPSFRMAAIEKVNAGITTIDELLRVLPYSALSHKKDSSTSGEIKH